LLPEHLLRVVRLFARLPGVGEKTAQRFALFLVCESHGLAAELANELTTLRERVQPCELCGNLAERDASGRAICAICADSRRTAPELCVVARVQDLIAIERSGAYRGRYFVLGRLLSPLDGIGPEDLPVDRLMDRVRSTGVEEIILATPPSVDGEATALLLARELGPTGVRVSRIASGVPHGGDLEFADQITLGRAISGRRVLDPSG
jgi:recombination protein RecR